MVQKPTFRDAFKFWLKLGFISFGGPAGQVAIIHEFVVEQKKWISESKFLHALNYCMLLPGPEAQQLATYIGWLLHGVRGGLVAGILFVLPSVFILLSLSIIYVLYGTVPIVASILAAIKPAVVAIVILAFRKIAQKSLVTYFHYGLAVLSFIAIYFLSIPFPVILLMAFIIGYGAYRFNPELIIQNTTKQSKTANDAKEEEYYINKYSTIKSTGFFPARVTLQLAIALLAWLLPLLILLQTSTKLDFWQTLVFFFTESALVTFGGAYAVLPFVAQVSVEKFKWLTRLQMMDGLALGESTPGPLIMVLAFVGFIAGFNTYEGALIPASLALLVTVYYTFLPSFLFILAGAPIIEKTQQNKLIAPLLTVVTAAIVGVVLNLVLYFCTAVIFPDGIDYLKINWPSLLWIIVSIIAMYKYKVSIMQMIFISAMGGLLYSLWQIF